MAFSSILDLWNKWNIRGSILLSLSLQVFLILFVPFRKKIANRRIVFLLWLAYLMADSIVVYEIGLISRNQGNSCTSVAEVDISLQALWASFFLLHLGGPNTITAFSLEDNSLWERHLLGLIFQVGVSIYLFVQIFLIPAMLVFLAGVIKNTERILSLHLSSLPRLTESILQRPRISWFAYLEMEEELNAVGDRRSDEQEATLAESIVVKHAYCFFQICRVFIADLIFKDYERQMSRSYFHKVSAMDALRVITVELNFMYEMLHTKALVIRSKWSYIFHFVAFTDLALALVLFNRLKKNGLLELDVDITYFLIFGAMALDVIALFMLIFSDWTVAGIKWYNIGSTQIDTFFPKLLSTTDNLRKPRSAACEAEPNANATYAVLDTPFIFRRWSESIFACNFLSEVLKQSPRKLHKHDQSWDIFAFSNSCSFPWRVAEKIISYFHQASQTIAGLCGLLAKLKIANTSFVSKNPFIQDLWIFIFKEVRRKSQPPFNETNVREISEARGDLFLTYKPGGTDGRNLLRYVNQASYDSSILCWHIATEICYNMEKPTERNEQREFSKMLSDYMLYLLLNQHDMMSGVAGTAQMMLADMVVIISDHIVDATKDVEELCKRLYDYPLENVRISALNEGVALVREMARLGETKWEVMSGVWVEMLSYAASHIKGEAHVRVLSEGGELLAFVWLLMAHFGCFYKPPWGIFYKPSVAMYVDPGGFR